MKKDERWRKKKRRRGRSFRYCIVLYCIEGMNWRKLSFLIEGIVKREWKFLFIVFYFPLFPRLSLRLFFSSFLCVYSTYHKKNKEEGKKTELNVLLLKDILFFFPVYLSVLDSSSITKLHIQVSNQESWNEENLYRTVQPMMIVLCCCFSFLGWLVGPAQFDLDLSFPELSLLHIISWISDLMYDMTDTVW